jgi:hypothetical protein
MAATPSLIDKLAQDFPAIHFVPGDDFSWSPDVSTVFYAEVQPKTAPLLIHELAHGVLGHHAYTRDVELLALESEAWEEAKTIAQKYDIQVSEDEIQDSLDTYREWMHARSTCPNCEATGFQTEAKSYHCIACSHTWRVNEARTCQLRRYSK